MKFEDLIDKDYGHEVLRKACLKNKRKGDRETTFRLQKKILKIFLKLIKDDLLNHQVFFFPKKVLSIQIASIKRHKRLKFLYVTGNTDAVGYIRTSVRMFKKMDLVKPYMLLRRDVFKEANKRHRNVHLYYRK